VPIASILQLTAKDVRTLKLYDNYSLHIIVHELFTEDSQRNFLLRDLGVRGDTRQILILSAREPNKPRAGTIQSKEIPDSFYENSEYQFDIMVNPVMEDRSTGKRKAVLGEAEIAEWFAAKAERSGFKVDPQALQVDHTGLVSFLKPGGRKVMINAAIIRGQLTSVDKEKFKEAAVKGFGRAKAFGFGLMQVVPV
jgi:CRISPR system Cascade subunit CasE